MYLLGAFISGWTKRRRGKIVAVGIMTVIVLLSDWGRGGYVLLWGDGETKTAWSGYHAVFL